VTRPVDAIPPLFDAGANVDDPMAEGDLLGPDRAVAAAQPPPPAPVARETIECADYSGHRSSHRRVADAAPELRPRWRCLICDPELAP
jgi:hypothetical protein